MVRRVLAVVLVLGCRAVSADAQSLGTFRFQLQPYCNVVTVAIVQQGAQYQLDGTDDQCGAGPRAAVTGVAFPNPNGLLGFGLSIVTAPGGGPVHVDADLNLGTLNGTWRDSAGNTGTFPLLLGAPAPGAPRPPAAPGDISAVAAGVGLAGGGTSGPVLLAVDFAATQQRVTGTCSAGQLMTGVNQNGTVACQSVTGAGGGDITAVHAGGGLTGGATTGDATLAVSFAGPGAATSVARSDHTHALPGGANTGAGASALAANSGNNNTAFGDLALQDNTTGAQNTAVGSSALGNNVSGQGNVAVGASTLGGVTTAGENVAVGVGALQVTTVSATTAVGGNALNKNTTGVGNSAFGYRALLDNTTGTANTAVGNAALGGNTTAARNTAVGHSALTLNQTGADNVAVGYTSLFTNTGSFNTSVGSAALLSNQSGFLNVAMGFEALRANTTGDGNTGLGSYALRSVTTGVGNTAVGRSAGAGNLTGSSNVAVGSAVLLYNQSGDANVGVGSGALSSNTGGSSNVAVGRTALELSGNGSNNVGLGDSALRLATGNNNIAIGANAGSGVTAGSNNIYLGATAPNDESGTIRIGSGSQVATYVRGISGATSSGGVQVFVDANGKLGTLTSSARFKVDVTSVGEAFSAGLQALRPVRFVYKPEYDDGARQMQYGLIAEEVAAVFPELVVRDASGQVQTVRYHFLAPLLLAEVQRLERERAALAGALAAQSGDVARLRAEMDTVLAITARERRR